MSAVTPCPACSWGDHANHVHNHQPAPKGALGGAVCICSGDCKAPDLSHFFPSPGPSERNTDDRQQHIDTLARAIDPAAWAEQALGRREWEDFRARARAQATAIFDSTNPNLHDALTAALHANADPARVLTAHANAGWLDEEWTVEHAQGRIPEPMSQRHARERAAEMAARDERRRPEARGKTRLVRRLVTPWEPTP